MTHARAPEHSIEPPRSEGAFQRRRLGSSEKAIKSPPMQIDGRVMSASAFVSYMEGLQLPAPLPARIFLHHTWKPTRESWNGASTMAGMKAYYEKQLWRDAQGRLREGWTAGPHLFVAEDGIWLFSDIRYDGVGVYGHNTGTRHLEMVGDYDNERPSGATWQNTIAALGIMHVRMGLDINKLTFHRDHSTKSCPGRAVTKEWVIPQVAKWIDEYRLSKAPVPVPDTSYSDLKGSLTGLVRSKLLPGDSQTVLAQAARHRHLLGPLSYQVPMEINRQSYLVQVFAEALMVPADNLEQVRSLSEMVPLLRMEPEETAGLPDASPDAG